MISCQAFARLRGLLRRRGAGPVCERDRSLRTVGTAGFLALVLGLTNPASGHSAETADQRTSPDPVIVGAANPAAEDSFSYLLTPFKLASQPNLKQSVFVFAGRTNSGNLGSTFTHGIGAPEKIFYDNYIVGGAYQRDFLQFNSGLLIGAEIGFADRFGHYSTCCDPIFYSDRIRHSAELWGGVSFRHQGPTLFDTIRISPGFVFGLSAISNPIGQEGMHQVDHQGSAELLFYLGFDLAFALAQFPNTELVLRIHHRSGAYGTLGGMKEGNNANVIGIRHRF